MLRKIREKINREFVRSAALTVTDSIKYVARLSYKAVALVYGFIVYALKIKRVRQGMYATAGLVLFIFLFLPGLLFGNSYRVADKKLMMELAEARQCSLQWKENEGLKGFVMTLVALEDRGFFFRSTWITFDLRGIGRAMGKNLLHFGISEGGSSLQWQVAKLVSGGPVRQRSLWNKLMEARLSLNLRGASRDEILTLYSKHIDCGLLEEQGIVNCSLNLYGKFPEDLMPEEGAALAGLQSAPSILRNDPERLNARVERGIEWLKSQKINITFARDGEYIAPFSDYAYFRGFQPPSACYYKDRDNWMAQKIVIEAFGKALPDLRKKAVLRSEDPNISIGSLTIAASPPYRPIARIGKWMEGTPVEAGSILKPLLIEIYIRWMGVHRVNSIQIPVGVCALDLGLRPYCPKDLGSSHSTQIDLATAVAKSTNSASVISLVMLPYLVYADNPREYDKFVSVLTDEELSRYSIWPDRVLAARILSEILGREVSPSDIPKSLSYRAAQLASLRQFKQIVKEYTGYEIGEYLSSVLGSEVRISPLDIAKAYSRLFFPSSDCTASPTAEMLGMHAADGTLKATIGQAGNYPAKTGTTDYSAIAVIGACVTINEHRQVPVVSIINAVDHAGNQLGSLKASTLGEGFVLVKNEIENFGYAMNPPKLN